MENDRETRDKANFISLLGGIIFGVQAVEAGLEERALGFVLFVVLFAISAALYWATKGPPVREPTYFEKQCPYCSKGEVFDERGRLVRCTVCKGTGVLKGR